MANIYWKYFEYIHFVEISTLA